MAIREISAASDVTEECLAASGELFLMWYDNDDDEPIDWESFFDRLESYYGWSVLQFDSPAANKVKRHVRKMRQEGK